MEEVFSGFYKFFHDMKEGKLDKTTQFWASYIDFMHLYHDFKNKIKQWMPLQCPCRLCLTYLPQIGFL